MKNYDHPFVGETVLYVGLDEQGERAEAVPAVVLAVHDDHEVGEDPNLDLLAFSRKRAAKEYERVPPCGSTVTGSGWEFTVGGRQWRAPVIVAGPAGGPSIRDEQSGSVVLVVILGLALVGAVSTFLQ